MAHDLVTPSRSSSVPASEQAPATLRRVAPAGPASLGPRGSSLQADSACWSALLGEPAPGPVECAALEGLAQYRTVNQGQVVFSRSDLARQVVAVRDGEVALGFRTADGIFRTERLVRGPAWLDLASGWLGEPHAMDAQAWTLATVVALPCDALQNQFERLPALSRRVIQGLSREVQALAVNTHELMHKDAPARLAQWLHQRCETGGADAGAEAVVRLHERKRDVASQLAITPETLSRLMRSFTRQGVIEVAGYTVRVLDVAGLKALAQA